MHKWLMYPDDEVDVYCQKISRIVKNTMWIVLLCIWYIYPKC